MYTSIDLNVKIKKINNNQTNYINLITIQYKEIKNKIVEYSFKKNYKFIITHLRKIYILSIIMPKSVNLINLLDKTKNLALKLVHKFKIG
jgi:hypothetical protein